MLLEYYGPKPVKTVTRFGYKEYRFDPFCEVDDGDAQILLAECGDIFRVPAAGAAGPEPETTADQASVQPQENRSAEDDPTASSRPFRARQARRDARKG